MEPGPLSPRTRGWTARPRQPFFAAGVVPAHAGVDRGPWGERHDKGSCPRARGGGPIIVLSLCYGKGLSPRTRGWTDVTIADEVSSFVVPAHAGVDRVWPAPDVSRPSCPRARGGGPVGLALKADQYVLSPRTRGWTGKEGGYGPDCEVVPAHAGVDRL